ncbi:hypothetical protein [Pseudoduganella sp. HUAS MS19]
MKLWLPMFALALVTGCATSAKPIPDNIPHALLKFGPAQGIEGIGAYWFDNDKCQPGEHSGKVGTMSWMSGREAQATVPSDKAVYVAQHWAVGGAGGCGTTVCLSSCSSMVQFVPQNGRTYAAKLELHGNSCATKIVDISEGDNVSIPVQRPVASCLNTR